MAVSIPLCLFPVESFISCGSRLIAQNPFSSCSMGLFLSQRGFSSCMFLVMCMTYTVILALVWLLF